MAGPSAAPASAPAPPSSARRSETARSLGSREKEAIRRAVQRARRLPPSLGEEEAVRKLLRIRSELNRDLLKLHDPRRRARRWLAGGLLASMLSAAVVVAAGIWRVADRLATPLGPLDDPTTFLATFSLLFLLAWVPAIVGAVQARRARRSAGLAPTLLKSALLLYDLTVVRDLIKQA